MKILGDIFTGFTWGIGFWLAYVLLKILGKYLNFSL